MKKYVTPSIACVELRTEEKFAACSDGSCDFDTSSVKDAKYNCSGAYVGLGS